MTQPSLIFQHIPKTAGSTFLAILRAYYGVDKVRSFDIGADPDAILKAIEDGVMLSCRAISGHIPSGMERLVLAPHCMTAFFRNPPDRLISDYYFLLKQVSHPLHGRIASGDLTLADLARNRNIFVPAYYWLGFDLADLATHKSFGAFIHDTSEEEAYDKGLAALERLTVVGVREQFDQSVDFIAASAGWTHVPLVRAHNVTEKRPSFASLSAEMQDILLTSTAREQQFYNLVLKRFQSQMDGKLRLA